MLNKKMLLLSFVLAASAAGVQASDSAQTSPKAFGIPTEAQDGSADAPSALNSGIPRYSASSVVPEFKPESNASSPIIKPVESDKLATSKESNVSSSCGVPRLLTRTQVAVTGAVLVGAVAFGVYAWNKRK
jgi:hypothetical protein